jgi:glutamate-1-semialdehyde 2,1-aminomutase
MTLTGLSADPARRPIPVVDLDALIVAAHTDYCQVRPFSQAADERARQVMPGGNTRSVLDFAPFPFRVDRAQGSELVDIDGLRYVDFCGNYTAALLGHSPAPIKEAIVAALDRGWALGATHEKEIELAELICARFESIEQVRFTNSGTEANLMAIGTALHHTGRSTVGVFDRAYHGGVLGFGPSVDGPHHPLNVPHQFHVAPFDDLAGLESLFADPDLGCVLVEVVQGSGGCRPASIEFLTELRRRCTDHDVVLIFDEVMTSRLAPGGAQERFSVVPDMTTLGKYLGGGMTFGAFGGRRKFLAAFDPNQGGALTQAGTFNNNIVSMSAAVAALTYELAPEQITAVNNRGDNLRDRLNNTFSAADAPMWATGVGSMVCIHGADDRLVELVFHAALKDGLYLARRGFMALSMAITAQDCDALIASVDNFLTALNPRR